VIAYIPARGGSKRVPRKNIRPLGGVPVLGRVLQVLTRLDAISGVFVSTDDPAIAVVAEKYGGIWLGPREPALSDDKAGFIDLMHRDVPRHCDAAGGDREVLFVLATAALVPLDVYRSAQETWIRCRPDILMSVLPFAKSPYWALVPSPDGYLRPLFPKMVRVNSQDLPPAYTDAGLFYIFDVDVMQRFGSHKDVDRLQPFLVDKSYGIDVDNEDDWTALEECFVRSTGGGKNV
jgi:pseudaminic acid cytidylyltransferase